jgi:Uma2 family endonuclease
MYGEGMESTEQIYWHLRELRDRLAVETGRFGEISDGEIVMMMSPVPQHGLTAKRIVRQFDAQLPAPLAAFEQTDTDDEHLGKLRMPDIVVVDEDTMNTTNPLDPHEISLAMEIVSRSNPDNDCVKKVADYASMDIPDYLIVDPRNGTARHHWRIVIKDGRPVYDNQVSCSYGDTIPSGDLRIDTSALPLYDDGDRP